MHTCRGGIRLARESLVDQLCELARHSVESANPYHSVIDPVINPPTQKVPSDNVTWNPVSTATGPHPTYSAVTDPVHDLRQRSHPPRKTVRNVVKDWVDRTDVYCTAVLPP